jgi:hypothetical protein
MKVIIDKLILKVPSKGDNEPCSFSRKTLTGRFSISIRVSAIG